jgi:UbiD family decarboxylase
MPAQIKERSMLHVPNDSYFESLRDLLSHLEKIGKLRRITKQVDKDWEIACVTRQVMYQRQENRYALLFENISGFDTPIATNTLGASRDIYATALGVPSIDGCIEEASIRNKRLLEETDESVRIARLDDMRRASLDPSLAKAVLMRSSMIESMRRANSIV